jgi:hypothetical protein
MVRPRTGVGARPDCASKGFLMGKGGWGKVMIRRVSATRGCFVGVGNINMDPCLA